MIRKGPYSIDKYTQEIKELEQKKRYYGKKVDIHLAILKYSIMIIVFIALISISLMPFLLLTYVNYKTISAFIIPVFVYYLVFILRNDRKYDKYYEKIWEYKDEFEEKSTKVPLKTIINHIHVDGNFACSTV